MSKSRRNHSVREKASIIRCHLFDKESVSDICEDIDIVPTQYYRWQKEFVDNAEVIFEKRDCKSNNQIRRLEEEVEKLKLRLKHKDSVIAEIIEDYVNDGYRRFTYMMMDEDIVAVNLQCLQGA